MYDLAVIGGGVVGGMILRELSKYQLKVCLLEKENDVAMGQSKANSGIAHAGFDAAVGSLKAKFNLLGSKMMPEVTKELGVKYENNGSLVVAFSDEELATLETLKRRGEENGVEGLEIIDRERLRELEPNISKNALGALHAKTGGIVCPYELTIAAIGNAMDNGAELLCNFDVTKIEGNYPSYRIVSADGQVVEAKAIINCAGLGSQKIANLVGDTSFTVGGRKGEYILLDHDPEFVHNTLFFTPTAKGKGILVSRTVDNNILLGPTAEEVEEDDRATTAEGQAAILKKAQEMCENLPLGTKVTGFTGVRAYCDRHDFILEESKVAKGFFHCAGVESPGLTSAPAIAKFVVEELVATYFALKKNPTFNPIRTPDYFFKNLSFEEKNALIQKEPAYGRMICRCEMVTEGEILRAMRENPKATDVDGVKRRVRAGMGRCQGGFCQPLVMELLAKEFGLAPNEITKKGKGSELLIGKCK